MRKGNSTSTLPASEITKTKLLVDYLHYGNWKPLAVAEAYINVYIRGVDFHAKETWELNHGHFHAKTKGISTLKPWEFPR